MPQEALGLLECKGLVALIEGTDAMLKAANVEMMGWDKAGWTAFTAAIFDLGVRGLVVMREVAGTGGTALVLYEAGQTPVIVSQIGSTFTTTGLRANTSLGYEQAELLRRVNAELGDRLPLPGPYAPDVKSKLDNFGLIPTGLPPAEHLDLPIRTGDVRVDVQSSLAALAPLWGFKPLLDTSFEDWTRVLAVNLNGPFLMVQAFATATASSAVCTPHRPPPMSTSTRVPMPGRPRANSTESVTTVSCREHASARSLGLDAPKGAIVAITTKRPAQTRAIPDRHRSLR